MAVDGNDVADAKASVIASWVSVGLSLIVAAAIDCALLRASLAILAILFGLLSDIPVALIAATKSASFLPGIYCEYPFFCI